jgi:integrase/recombinase XerC
MSMQFLQYIQAFTDYLRYEKRFSENTIAAYDVDLRQFSEFLSERYPDTKTEDIDGFMIKS